ncbi:MAG: SPFH domain-containing protein [Deltaproteobacteria bacterium]|nr:SPFH domain-containing protein [Deltaproteobacteria bacterium]
MDVIISVAPYAAAAVGVVFGIAFTIATLWKKAGPNEALVISGTGKVRLRVGGGAVVIPMFQKFDRLSLEVITIDVSTPEVYTEQGVPVQVDGIAQVKVQSTDVGIRTAAEQFLGRGLRDIQAVARQTLEGHLRAILGTMIVEEIYKNREGFSQRVQEAAVPDLAHMGLRIVSFTLRDIKDSHGYLDALGQPRLAQVKRDAIIAQAEADRDAQIRAAKAKQEGESARYIAETQIAEANRDYESKRAEYQAAVNEKKAAADLAYDLQRFKTGQAVKEEEVKVELVEKEQQIAVQEKEIQRRQRELEATVQKPADAKRYAVQTEADAEKYKLTAEAEGRAQAQQAQGFAEAAVIKATGEAEATASRQKGLADAEVIKAKGLSEAEAMEKKAASWEKYNSAAVTQMFVEMLPKMAAAVSAPLAKTEKIVIVDAGGEGGGASRLTRDIAAVMAQVPPVLEELSGVRLQDLVARVPGLGGNAQQDAEGRASETTVETKKG